MYCRYELQQEIQLRLVRLAAFIAAEDVDMRAGVRWLPRSRFTRRQSEGGPGHARAASAPVNLSPTSSGGGGGAPVLSALEAADSAAANSAFQSSDGHLLTQVSEPLLVRCTQFRRVTDS